ncbi:MULTISPECIES: hypothetical protein [Tsukamurella]|uniref:DUF4439 domain-containing protein n=1 Tax=Tsukamurella strandjordii TaxID=147577 RepID=A0AA90NG34_9ACTN|nr:MULTISPECIES: hypothetical protein [Tsukamurella]MDP0397815.1 hypothetical protein [Tsukamurella strandjordii]GIZ99259.1 hypothetical protein TTY48_38710 [Tsukamurella sp. TY48]
MRPEPEQPLRGTVDRRTALTSALLAGGALLGASALAGCAPEEKADDPQATRLEAAALAAQADADAARGLAVLDGAVGPQMRLIADQRSQHATALSDELSRYLRRPTSVSPPTSSAAPAPGGTLNRQTFAAQLARSAKDAGDAAVAASGYQAALLGSVAAATRVHAEVVLG